MTFLIHQYLDIAASRDPDRPASFYLDESLSYSALSKRSGQLAAVLADSGVHRHDRVGIYMDKSIHTPVALYGIMRAGAAYVPLDPAAPPARVASVIRDCGIRHIVSADNKLRALRKLCEAGCELDAVIGLSDTPGLPFEHMSWDQVASADGERSQPRKVIESDLAYIIYTSGSTGQPKGIMHTHHSGLSFARWAAGEYALVPEDRLSNHAPLHFDLSIFDYFAGVVAGASTVIIPEEYTKLPASYTQLLADQKVSVLFTVPFALIQMALRGSLEKRDLSALRWAIFGGEPFPPDHLRRLMRQLPHVRFDNMYGPAEINGCTHYTVREAGEDAVPIGPIADCAEALVIGTDGNQVAKGDVGELLVRTPTMMQGYWRRDDLNSRAFMVRNNSIGRKEVFFRTGDLVQELEDGNLRFVGRKDRQVKIRGFRIELDEIELALAASTDVEEAAAYLLQDPEGSKRLGAQVTLRSGSTTTVAELTKDLKTRLPWYAIPEVLAISPGFPRTRTGKIDRRLICELAQKKLREKPHEKPAHSA